MSITSFRRRPVPIAVVALGVSLAAAGTAAAGGSHHPPAPKNPPAPCVKGVGTACTTDVAIAKTADRATYGPNDTITYTLTVTNTGEAPVSRGRIVVTDPQLADLAPATPLTGWLSYGQSVVFTGTRTLTRDDCGEVSNTATVALAPSKAGRPDIDTSNDSSTVVVPVVCEDDVIVPPPEPLAPAPGPAVVATVVAPPPPPAVVQQAGPPPCPRPLLTARLSGPRTATAGGIVVVRLSVHAARTAASGVRVRLRLPAGVSVTGARAARLLRGGDLVLGIGRLARGATRTLPVALRLDAGVRGRRTLTAGVTATCGGAATATAVVRAAAAPSRVQPAVTG